MSRKNRELSEQWASRIKAQRASGQTQKEWCKQEGLSQNTMQWWIKRLGMQAKSAKPVAKDAGVFTQVVPIAEPISPPKESQCGGD